MHITDIIRKVKQIEIRTKKNAENSLLGQYRSAFKGQGMSFSEVRQYQAGDDIRRIDWNKTAQFQEPFVKVMEEERELTIMLMVDISASMDYGTQTALKKEFVAEICASIGFSAVGNNDKVGLILFADKIYKIIPPKKGKKHILSFIRHILSAEYVPTPTQWDTAIDTVMNVLKKKSLLFLFSDFNDNLPNQNLKVMSIKHQLWGIRVYDEKDNEIPDIGVVEFQDAETGETIWVNTSDARFRYDFLEQNKKKIKDLKNTLEKSSAHFLNLKTGDDYAKEFYKIR